MNPIGPFGLLAASLRLIPTRRIWEAYYTEWSMPPKRFNGSLENTQAAESRIRDTDMAEESVAFTKTRYWFNPDGNACPSECSPAISAAAPQVVFPEISSTNFPNLLAPFQQTGLFCFTLFSFYVN